ncbi:MAG: LD-carboxypeptidase [Defluviitaleaceae bacterium]|nr:LD-carboxypeptidase [Defluviitaleaceae bacterium]
MVYPPLLHPGDNVAIVAPAGPPDPARLARGVRVLESLGLHCHVMESCRAMVNQAQNENQSPRPSQLNTTAPVATPLYLSAPDALRTHDLLSAFANPCIRAIFCARGGYGTQRLLPLLDFDLIQRNPKIFAGYSDITALHIAFNQRCNLVTYHAPMIAADFGGDGFSESEADKITLQSFQSALFNRNPINIASPFFMPLTQTQSTSATPVLPPHPVIGGNLSIVAASLGTPYEIDTHNCILFLEEINEPPYRIDRMLTQLQLAGKLDGAAGFLFGDFSPLTSADLANLLASIKIPPGKPISMGFPGGHTSPNITLQLGG